jgi:putative transposase
MCRNKQSLPNFWPKNLKSALIHIIAMARITSLYTRSRCIKNKSNATLAQLQQAQEEVNLLKEELLIKDFRMKRIPAAKRPHYTPTERLAILELKAARGWSNTQTAEAFLICPDTIDYWSKMLDSNEPKILLRMSQPVNKLPDFVNYIVARLKILVPAMGKVKIAHALTKAGLLLSASTVARILKNNNVPPGEPDNCPMKVSKKPYARYPNHIWNIDLTVVPTSGGFGISWLPFAVPQVWPFCWWLACILDQYSRCIIGFALFKKQPTAVQIRDFLKRASRKNNCVPEYIITDKGVQFTSRTFRKWCKRKYIGLRYGAVGKYGSIALIERVFRTLKTDWLRKIIVPLDTDSMRRNLTKYIRWYNCYRPHQSLNGTSPAEIYEPKLPQMRPVNLNLGEKCRLIVTFYEGDRKLPIIRLEKAA